MNKRAKAILISALAVVVVVVGLLVVYRFVINQNNSEKLPINEVSQELKDYKFFEHSNITFDCNVKNTNIQNVCTFESYKGAADAVGDEEYERCKELVKIFTGVDVDDSMREYIQDSEATYSGEYEDGHFSASYYNNGTFTVSRSSGNSIDYNSIIIEKIIDPDDDLSGMSYKVDGEEYKIEDVVNYVQSYIDENLMSFFNDGEELKLSDILVTKNDDFNDYEYVLHYVHLIDGVEVDDCGFTNVDGSYMHESFFEVILSSKDYIRKLENRCYYKQEDVKEIKKIIPLSEAEELLADTLAPNVGYNISECELKYCCLVKSDDYGEYYTYEPMWSFTLKTNEGGYMNGLYLNYTTAYLNALTGDVVYYNMDNDELVEYDYKNGK